MEAIVIGQCCSVPECSSSISKDVSLHYFPHRDTSLLEKWKRALKIEKPIKKSMAVCSRHFLADDYEKSPKNTRRRRLKNCAIPSRNLPIGETNNKKTIKRVKMKLPNSTEISKDPKEIISNDKEKPTVNVSTLTDPPKFNLLEVFGNDKSIKILTGVDRNTLNKIIENVGNILKLLNDNSFPDVAQSVLLVLLRLKLNLSFSCLSVLLGVSATKGSMSCSAQFFDMLSIIYEAVQEVDWPSKDRLLKKMQKYIYTVENSQNCICNY